MLFFFFVEFILSHQDDEHKLNRFTRVENVLKHISRRWLLINAISCNDPNDVLCEVGDLLLLFVSRDGTNVFVACRVILSYLRNKNTLLFFS